MVSAFLKDNPNFKKRMWIWEFLPEKNSKASFQDTKLKRNCNSGGVREKGVGGGDKQAAARI